MPRVHRTLRLLSSILLAGWAVACASGRYGPSASSIAAPTLRDLDALTTSERIAILRTSQVWHPVDTNTLDILKGPLEPAPFAVDEAVTCNYVFPAKRLAGRTPKFRCAIEPGPD